MSKKILVVDDEPNILKVLTERLKLNDYEVICASDGLEALEKAQNQSPDLIILDIMMPNMDGFEAGSKLKADDKTKSIPIIVLSAKGDKNTIVKTMGKVCAKDYIVKPFRPEILLEKVKEILEKKL